MQVVIAAAQAIVMIQDCSKLVEFGDQFQLSKTWAFSLLCWMDFVKYKTNTAKSKYTIGNFAHVKKFFLDSIVTTVNMKEISQN